MTMPTENTSMAGTPPSKSSFSIANVLMVALPLVLIIGGVGGWMYYSADAELNQKINTTNKIKVGIDTPLKLSEKFTDADGDMVADTPTDPSKWIDPKDGLVFSILGDPEKEKPNWVEFAAHLKEKTGKEVQITSVEFINNEQLEKMTEGNTHILSLSTGTVPGAVNLGGFVPLFVMGDKEGKWGYQMEMIVPADSSINDLKDLRGKKIAFSNFRSHSGFKMPAVLLWTELQMLPDRDYNWIYAGRAELGLARIQSKEIDACPIASDLLAREAAKPEDKRPIAPGAYKSIYKSKTFPPACFGVIHNLKPDLAKQIKDAFTSFNWSGTALEKAYAAANQSKFVPISYKDDWAVVRQVDEQMTRFVEAK